MAEDGENLEPSDRRVRTRSSASLPAIPGHSWTGSGRRDRSRMKKSVLYVLLAAALAVAALVGLTSGASAEQRTVTVRLADGTLTTVTVDVPPGTPLGDIQLPPPPAVPTVPLPVPTPPPAGSPPPPGGSPDQGTPPNQSNPDQAPNANGNGGKQKKSGDNQKATPNALHAAPQAQPPPEVQKKLDKINQN